MKRLGLTLVMGLVCASTTVFAQTEQSANGQKWDGAINKAKLTKYLQLSATQHEEVASICDFFEEQMKTANRAKQGGDEKVRNAVYGNLKLMKKTLDDKQYSDYLRLMALTLRNRGIELDKK